MSFSASFSKLAKWTAHASGRPTTFGIAFAVIVVWAVTGPVFHFSDTWQLVINTGTTVVTFLMVFLIQNTQNRDATAMQIKLDELVRAVQGAHNAVVSMEDAEEQELVKTKARYDELAARARARAGSGAEDTDSPELEGEVAAARIEAGEAKGEAARAERTADDAKKEVIEAEEVTKVAYGAAKRVGGSAEAVKDAAANAEQQVASARETAQTGEAAAAARNPGREEHDPRH